MLNNYEVRPLQSRQARLPYKFDTPQPEISISYPARPGLSRRDGARKSAARFLTIKDLQLNSVAPKFFGKLRIETNSVMRQHALDDCDFRLFSFHF